MWGAGGGGGGGDGLRGGGGGGGGGLGGCSETPFGGDAVHFGGVSWACASLLCPKSGSGMGGCPVVGCQCMYCLHVTRASNLRTMAEIHRIFGNTSQKTNQIYMRNATGHGQ